MLKSKTHFINLTMANNYNQFFVIYLLYDSNYLVFVKQTNAFGFKRIFYTLIEIEKYLNTKLTTYKPILNLCRDFLSIEIYMIALCKVCFVSVFCMIVTYTVVVGICLVCLLCTYYATVVIRDHYIYENNVIIVNRTLYY